MQTILAQAADDQVFPTWVLGGINLGMLGLMFYMFSTRRTITPGEMEARLQQQKESYEARIADIHASSQRSIDATLTASKQAVEASDLRCAQERERADRNEDKLADAHQLIVKETTPAMLESAHALDRSNELWQGIVEKDIRQRQLGGGS